MEAAITLEMDEPEGGWGRVSLHFINGKLLVHHIPVVDEDQEPGIVIIKPAELGVSVF